ncbi:hypothetical protein [Spirosoma oryzicola]|uniref:hypothetical protein n=1 Tax=Spirosoma oryzicola TaxID=2898794 RepID=UPI001E3E1754|nr:hypothetical protein [Spirosoma oryzicola]UHG92526.1 hypothetical protein LQ777_06365 [Spirosoma oryzicola]
MNKLPVAKQAQIIQLMVEGKGLQAVSRIADVSINTVTKLLVNVGQICQGLHNATVVNLDSQCIQYREIESFACNKVNTLEENVVPEDAKDIWTFTGIDNDSKLIVSWYVGYRDVESALKFINQLTNRTKNRVELKSTNSRPYSIPTSKGFNELIDFSQLTLAYSSLVYGINVNKCISSEHGDAIKKAIEGLSEKESVSSFCMECQDLTRPPHSRLTNAVRNYSYAIALHFVYYNFCQVDEALGVTPAMKAKLVSQPMSIEQILEIAQ